MDNRIAITLNELVNLVKKLKAQNETDIGMTQKAINNWHIKCAEFTHARLVEDNNG